MVIVLTAHNQKENTNTPSTIKKAPPPILLVDIRYTPKPKLAKGNIIKQIMTITKEKKEGLFLFVDPYLTKLVLQ